MSKKQSAPEAQRASQFLRQARDLAGTQAALHYQLSQLQQRVAGLVPRRQLDRLYASGVIDGEEYVNLLLAQGWSEVDALSHLAKVHASPEAAGKADPFIEPIEPDLPQYSGPTRTARKPMKAGPQLRGHPLD